MCVWYCIGGFIWGFFLDFGVGFGFLFSKSRGFIFCGFCVFFVLSFGFFYSRFWFWGEVFSWVLFRLEEFIEKWENGEGFGSREFFSGKD